MDKLYVMCGEEAEALAVSLLEEMDVAEELKGFKRPLIGIKPNLVVSQPAQWGATTEPGLVRGVVRYLKSRGFNTLVIMESSWLGDNTRAAFRVCGYEDLSREFNLPLVDLKKDKGILVEAGGLKFEVCSSVLAVDYLINMPVLKAHCQTKLSCALKNLKGCIPDKEKRRFHALGLHRPIACLNMAVRPGLTVVDGIFGDLLHEEGGNPVKMGRVIAGRDPVLVDSYAAALLGYDVDDVPYIRMAEELGVGSSVLEGRVVERNSVGEFAGSFPGGREIDFLKKYVEEDMACSPCYGGVMHALMRLKEKGKLKGLPGKVQVGQGFKGRGGYFGVGECARGCESYVRGCPPKAREIVAELEKWLSLS
ncbi:MAG: DUF362 domain-containing protein [Dethiobacter sp.]|nr:DUF362 domain-containing protein [Dethiobacter sp.]